MIKITSKALFLLIILVSITNCSKEDELSSGNELQMTEREQAIFEYNENYLGSEIHDPGWTGNIATCDAGSVPQTTHDLVTKRLNYFRELVGLNTITLDESQFDKYQHTALLMKANNQVSHYPPETWACWTEDSADGASDSNLTSSHSTDAITSFIEDRGQNNKAVGHRRWILHSSKTKFSYGTTNSTMSLAVKGVANGNTQIPTFIAYPPNGYVPRQLVFSRWSFSIPNANFSAADIKMKGPEGDIDLNIVSNEYNQFSFIGDNTIVWEPQGVITNSSTDQSYTIVVSNVENTTQSSYTYEVTIIEPEE